MKITAMIPALLGSTRIPDKNLVLVDGKILSDYTVESCRNAQIFSQIYINSEDDVFAKIAEDRDILFYQRNKKKGGSQCELKNKSKHCKGQRCVINDHYLYDFMKNIDSDYVFQVNPTSPLLKSETIRDFVDALINSDGNSAFATFNNKAESFYKDVPVNFDSHRKVPSQELSPIQSICWAIAGWKRSAFIENYELDDPETETPVFQTPRILMPVNELEALDIDEWSTLFLCEELLKLRNSAHNTRKVSYIDGQNLEIQI